jgi:arylsulfatase A-like enzyme
MVLLCSSILPGADSASPPNVVLVMADDQGWGDTGYNGHPDLKTPHLDDLAKTGLRLNRFYTAHFNCSPTRASVMTGRSPIRMGTFTPGSPIRAQELTVAEVLRSAGYATGHFGKWHLNGQSGPGRPVLAADPLSPGKLGFDAWVSASNYFDLDPELGRNGVAEKFQGDSSDVAADEALKFIRKQAAAGKPFLSVVWFGSPHVPHRALPADKALYGKLTEKEQNYYGEITAVDRNVGKLRAALKDLKLTDNTIFWYCSDNGGHEGPKSTGHLRGQKGTMWDGGLRVPGLVEWPARIPTPVVSDVPCCTLDMYPTILEATGAVAKNQVRPLDGISLIPLFEGKMESRSKAIPFWAHAKNLGGHAVLLDWPYKLHLHPAPGKKAAGKDDPLPAALLFDVASDPNETTDLAAKEPARVAKMTAQLRDWQASVEKSLAGADYAATPRK